MTILFPSTLPHAEISGYQFAPDSTTISTDMDSGPPRVRRRYTKANTHYQSSWTFTQQQLATFEAWFVLNANSGAAWFSMPAFNGKGMTTVTARISSGTYTAKLINYKTWQVTAALEVSDRPLLTLAELTPYL